MYTLNTLEIFQIITQCLQITMYVHNVINTTQ